MIELRRDSLLQTFVVVVLDAHLRLNTMVEYLLSVDVPLRSEKFPFVRSIAVLYTICIAREYMGHSVANRKMYPYTAQIRRIDDR